MFRITSDVSEMQRLMRDNLRTIAALKPRGSLGNAVRHMLVMAHRSAVIRTHVDTGALRASQRMDMERNQTRGYVHIAKNTRNPRTGAPPSVYGLYEHARGGMHAFYERTVRDDGQRIASAGLAMFMRGLP